MKRRIIFAFICVLFIISRALSQYCVLPGQTPYAPQQPGITNFKLNTINRTSGNSESPSSVLVATGLTTTLTAGQSYTISISHSEDAFSFPGARNNLRVWLDYNSNFAFTNPGETILLKDLEAPATTYTATFVVPLATAPGSYRLRATAKMSADAGHTLPTSCNSPADPLGYHGEMEDYTIVIESSGTGQSPTASFLMSSTVCVNSAITVTNTSAGNPSPTFSWTANPVSGVVFTPNSSAANPQISFANGGSHTISCTATNSVSSTSVHKSIFVNKCSLVGLAETGLDNLVVLGPNPAANFLNVSFPDTYKTCSVELLNCLGQTLIHEQAPTHAAGSLQINLSNIANGIYYIKVTLDNASVNRQIIIHR